MKKYYFVLMFFLLLTLSGCSTGSDPYFVIIRNEGDLPAENYDILVRKSDFELYYSSFPNNDYTRRYPNYSNYEYLDTGEEFISYCAYVTEGCYLDYDWIEEGEIYFGGPIENMRQIKFLIFDDDGKTIAESRVYRLMPYNTWYLDREVSFDINTDTNEITMNQRILVQDRVFLLIPFASIFIILGSFINLIFSRIIGRNSKLQKSFYFITVISYYILCFSIYFLPIRVMLFSLSYFIIVGVTILYQVLWLYHKFKPQYLLKRIIISVLLSHIVLMIISIVFFYQGYSL